MNRHGKRIFSVGAIFFANPDDRPDPECFLALVQTREAGSDAAPDFHITQLQK
jgi:hypothetical protein